jgi:hypothetical protein
VLDLFRRTGILYIMPGTSPIELKRLERRAKDAAALLKSIERIWAKLPKVPSFNGKARFMDTVLSAQKRAHNLAWDLARDVDEIRSSSSSRSRTRSK